MGSATRYSCCGAALNPYQRALNLYQLASAVLHKKQDRAMANFTVIKKAERIEACGKLLIEDFLEKMKEPRGDFISDVFKAGDFSFQIRLLSYPRQENNDLWAIVFNPTDTDFAVVMCSLEANFISS